MHINVCTYTCRYHLTATYDGSTMRLFTNGLLTTSSDAQSGPIRYPASSTFSIGAHIDKPNIFALRGALDDVALWNRAVGTGAVAAMYATQRDSSYFCCPSSCPDGTVSSGLCVGDVSVDCKPAYPCPKCSPGACVRVYVCVMNELKCVCGYISLLLSSAFVPHVSHLKDVPSHVRERERDHIYMYVYIYIYVYTYVCVYIYIYIYIHTHTYLQVNASLLHAQTKEASNQSHAYHAHRHAVQANAYARPLAATALEPQISRA
jgi:hypothetical protein